MKNMKNMALIAGGIAALTATAAYATTYGPYTVEDWPLKMTSQPAILAAGSVTDYWEETWIIEQCAPGSWTGHTCPHWGESAEWASSWSYVKCFTYNDATGNRQVYGMHFKADKNAWPGSWPASVTCTRTEGGDTVSAVTPIVNAPDTNGSGAPPTALATLGTTVTLTLTGNEGMEYDTKIPPAGVYTHATSACVKTGGGAFHGPVKVEVWEGGATDYLRFWANYQLTGAGTVTGTCPVVKDGVTYNVPVSIVTN